MLKTGVPSSIDSNAAKGLETPQKEALTNDKNP